MEPFFMRSEWNATLVTTEESCMQDQIQQVKSNAIKEKAEVPGPTSEEDRDRLISDLAYLVVRFHRLRRQESSDAIPDDTEREVAS